MKLQFVYLSGIVHLLYHKLTDQLKVICMSVNVGVHNLNLIQSSDCNPVVCLHQGWSSDKGTVTMASYNGLACLSCGSKHVYVRPVGGAG